MNEFILNIAPLIAFAQNCLMILGSLTLLVIFIFLLFGHKNTTVLIDHTNKLMSKYPLVDRRFYDLNVKEQNIENNQEIQELLEKQAQTQKMINELKELVDKINTNS